jgi:Zn-dependent protease
LVHNTIVQETQLIQTVLVYALPVLFAITLHEAAHGYAAKWLGDATAWQLGRVTLNPWAHIDWMGTIAMPIVLYLATSGAFLFGYAKPVPVNWGRLRRPKRDMVWVALAGPASNLLQALLWAMAWLALAGVGVQERFFIEMCQAGVLTNVVMFAFNLFPLPPLDGGRILTGLLPIRQAMVFARVEPYGFFIVMALLLLGVINRFWMHPVMELTYAVIDGMLYPLKSLFQ